MTTTEEMRDRAGWRSTHVARSTGRPVSVFDGIAQGLETVGGRWYTVCDDHGYLVSHQTLRLARWHASAPEDWCGVCNGQDPQEDELCQHDYAACIASRRDGYGDCCSECTH